MLLNIIHVIVMGIAFLYTFNKAQFAQTRLVALVPLGVLFIDLFSLRADFLAVPTATLLLTLLRIGVLACCVGALRADRRLAKAKARANMRTRMVMRTAAIAAAPHAAEQAQYA